MFLIALLIGTGIGYLICLIAHYRKRTIDEATERRKFFKEAFPPISSGIKREYGWHQNDRGMVLFEQRFTPTTGKIIGLIGICHGFGESTSGFSSELAERFCKNGFAVIMCDMEGHGFSDGFHTFIEDLRVVSNDISGYFLTQLKKEEYKDLPFFVYGESMGGANAFNLCTLHEIKKHIKGVILTCPMVKVSDEIKPPKIVVDVLMVLAKYVPYAPWAPVKDIADAAFKRREVLLRAKNSPLSYNKMPRLGTALASLNTTEDISGRMEQLEKPVLILHGDADIVTCPTLSECLYKTCASKDKSFKLYPGAYHNLLHGEPVETQELIFNDILTWLKDRL